MTSPGRDELASIPDRVSRLYRSRSRPLSAVQSIAVAATTAALIVGVGVYVAESRMPRTNPAPAQPQVVMIPMPNANVSAESARAPAPTAAPSSTSMADTIPGGFGLLTVTSPVTAIVFVNGHRAGKANEPLRALCGNRFVRIGTMSDDGDGPFWVAPGRTVGIPCQGSVSIELRPAPSPPSRSTRTKHVETPHLPNTL